MEEISGDAVDDNSNNGLPAIRRQASLYLPLPELNRIDALRQRFNPKQFALIPAHVTLCREDEVDDWSELERRLAAVGPISIQLSFGRPIRNDGLVYLPVSASTEAFDQLRHQLLAPDGEPPRKHIPHLTLIHPRNGHCTGEIFAELKRAISPFKVNFDEVSLIEQVDGGPWTQLSTYP